jgi:hypothetical protein
MRLGWACTNKALTLGDISTCSAAIAVLGRGGTACPLFPTDHMVLQGSFRPLFLSIADILSSGTSYVTGFGWR